MLQTFVFAVGVLGAVCRCLLTINTPRLSMSTSALVVITLTLYGTSANMAWPTVEYPQFYYDNSFVSKGCTFTTSAVLTVESHVLLYCISAWKIFVIVKLE
jgi:hypothetical protein